MGALLMLAPLVAVPILAVVGIPQFAPGNLIDLNGSKAAATSRDSRAFAEPRFGDAARHDADDLFAPLEESGADVEGFEDPLAGRKSRSSGRKSRRDVEDELAEEPARPSGKRLLPFEENQDEEFADSSVGELNGGEPEESDPQPRGRQRLRSKNVDDEFEATSNDAEPFNEFADTESPKTKPRGERFADASPSFGGKSNGRTAPGRRQQEELQEPEESVPESTDEGNPFEAAPVENKARPAPQKKPTPPARPRDPHDAPIFEPQESAPQTDEAANFAPPPAAKSANTGRRNPQAVIPPAPPEEVVEREETPAADDGGEQEQLAGVDELTWQVATKRLRALGVGSSKQYFTYLEASNSFLFSCTAAHAKNAKKLQRFEAEAEEPLLAVSQVLQQLEEWQKAPASRTVARGQE